MEQDNFELHIADFDTPIYKAATSMQENYIIVTHVPSGNKKEFSNKTEFYGGWKNKDGGWLADINFDRVESGKEPFLVEDFEIEELSRLTDEVDNHVEEALKGIDYSVGKLKKLVPANDYQLVIGGKENFRYDLAQEVPYKGQRVEKPLIFAELRDAFLRKYASKIFIAEGREADDYLSEKGYENYRHFMKTGVWKYCLSYIDKDIDMVVSPHVNPNKPELGIIYNSPLEAAKCYASQLLTGDKSVDNILGLPSLTEDIRDKYGIKKTNGLGKATADKLLDPCDTPKECFERVVEAYKSYYGPRKKHTFTNFRDEELKWGWKDFLSERANLLWMYRTEDCKYDIFEDTFKGLGVKV